MWLQMNQNVKVCRARGLQSLIAYKKLKGSLGEIVKYRSFPTEITLLAGFLISRLVINFVIIIKLSKTSCLHLRSVRQTATAYATFVGWLDDDKMTSS